MSKRLWTPDHHISMNLYEHPVPDLVPLCCYNELRFSGNASRWMLEHGRGVYAKEHYHAGAGFAKLQKLQFYRTNMGVIVRCLHIVGHMLYIVASRSAFI